MTTGEDSKRDAVSICQPLLLEDLISKQAQSLLCISQARADFLSLENLCVMA